jgi:hypothetical protein
MTWSTRFHAVDFDLICTAFSPLQLRSGPGCSKFSSGTHVIKAIDNMHFTDNPNVPDWSRCHTC